MTSIDLRGTAQVLEASMQCNCDLDNWQPERSTGHSWVCDIHRRCLAIHRRCLALQRGDAKLPCPNCNGVGWTVVNQDYHNPAGEQEWCSCKGEDQ